MFNGTASMENSMFLKKLKHSTTVWSRIFNIEKKGENNQKCSFRYVISIYIYIAPMGQVLEDAELKICQRENERVLEN